MIRIIAKKYGFRRAGVRHKGTSFWPDGYFTPAELAALKAEPALVVEEGVVEEGAEEVPEPESATEPESAAAKKKK